MENVSKQLRIISSELLGLGKNISKMILVYAETYVRLSVWFDFAGFIFHCAEMDRSSFSSANNQK